MPLHNIIHIYGIARKWCNVLQTACAILAMYCNSCSIGPFPCWLNLLCWLDHYFCLITKCENRGQPLGCAHKQKAHGLQWVGVANKLSNACGPCQTWSQFFNNFDGFVVFRSHSDVSWSGDFCADDRLTNQFLYPLHIHAYLMVVVYVWQCIQTLVTIAQWFRRSKWRAISRSYCWGAYII